jgi:glucokinase
VTEPASAGARLVGIDVGGTKALGLAIDASGTILAEASRPTPRGPNSLGPMIDTLA